MESTVLKIDGMTCGGCVRSVTNALQAAPGVSKVEVQLDGGLARVDYDPAVTSPTVLVELVDDIGFEASCSAT